MPITTPIVLRRLSKDEFARLDYQVMRLAFASQNELGRLCDEVIYQNDLAARLTAAGIGPVRTESPITVTHRDFSKTYSTDLIVAEAAMYELKTTTALTREHDAQLLNYVFLHDADHGKLVNFRPAQVESRFVNSALTPAERREFTVITTRWQEADDASRFLQIRLLELLNDWGGFLEVSLYVEALTCFLGGEQNVLRLLPLTRAAVPLGNQRFHLLAPDTAFRITALTNNQDHYEHHLQSLLAHSPLRAIQWINLNRHRIEFVSLEK